MHEFEDVSVNEVVWNLDIFYVLEPLFDISYAFSLVICNIVPPKVDSTTIIISLHIYSVPPNRLQSVANEGHHIMGELAAVKRIVHIGLRRVLLKHLFPIVHLVEVLIKGHLEC